MENKDKPYIKDGKGFIEVICQRLREQDVLLYDSNIVHLIETLTNGELNQIVSLGDVVKWHNERIEKLKTKEDGKETDTGTDTGRNTE